LQQALPPKRRNSCWQQHFQTPFFVAASAKSHFCCKRFRWRNADRSRTPRNRNTLGHNVAPVALKRRVLLQKVATVDGYSTLVSRWLSDLHITVFIIKAVVTIGSRVFYGQHLQTGQRNRRGAIKRRMRKNRRPSADGGGAKKICGSLPAKRQRRMPDYFRIVGCGLKATGAAG
jgi:hypothetical protein